MKTIWLYWSELKHNFLFNFSFKYRQALRLIELQDEKIFELRVKSIESNTALTKALKELEELKSISPFKGPKQFLADAINKEGDN
jgi:hypothetical protein